MAFPGAQQLPDQGQACAKLIGFTQANVAQSVEQLFRKQQVPGSSPGVGSTITTISVVHPA